MTLKLVLLPSEVSGQLDLSQFLLKMFLLAENERQEWCPKRHSASNCDFRFWPLSCSSFICWYHVFPTMLSFSQQGVKMALLSSKVIIISQFSTVLEKCTKLLGGTELCWLSIHLFHWAIFLSSLFEHFLQIYLSVISSWRPHAHQSMHPYINWEGAKRKYPSTML